MLISLRAISQGLSIVIAVLIILAAFLGYGFGAISQQQRTSALIVTTYSLLLNATTTITSTASQTVSITVTPYCCTDSNLSLSTPCSTIVSTNYPPVQRLQYLVETNPEFVAAENGHNYTTQFAGCGGGFSVGGGPNGTFVYFQSSYRTVSSYTNDCGNVGSFTYYLNVAVPLTETGYNMSAIRISPINSSEITITCSTTT